jgi:hypothetical protein
LALHGGRAVSKKQGSIGSRAWALAAGRAKRKFDLAISHNSYSQILAARVFGLKTITMMDYEHQPANISRSVLRLDHRAREFSDERLRRYRRARGEGAALSRDERRMFTSRTSSRSGVWARVV